MSEITKETAASIETFGQRLLYLRKEKAGLTREELSSLVNIKKETIKSWERDRRTLKNAEKLNILLEFYAQIGIDVDIKWLLPNPNEQETNLISLQKPRFNLKTSKSILHDKKTFMRAYDRAFHALKDQGKKGTLSEVLSEIEKQYPIILLETSKIGTSNAK